MLRFSKRPEPILLEIIDEAIRHAIGDLDFEDGEEQRRSFTMRCQEAIAFLLPWRLEHS
jgi:hypothetical protein